MKWHGNMKCITATWSACQYEVFRTFQQKSWMTTHQSVDTQQVKLHCSGTYKISTIEKKIWYESHRKSGSILRKDFEKKKNLWRKNGITKIGSATLFISNVGYPSKLKLFSISPSFNLISVPDYWEIKKWNSWFTAPHRFWNICMREWTFFFLPHT